MAVGTWKLYTRAKRNILEGVIPLGASGVYKMTLHIASASTNILKISNGGISTYGSVGSEISARGNYATGGLAIAPATGKVTVGASTKQMKFTYTATGLVFKASGAQIGVSAVKGIKFALIRNSTGAGAGKAICYCTLSTGLSAGKGFVVALGNTLTVTPAAAGVFTLA
jgi:hypothetical protein